LRAIGPSIAQTISRRDDGHYSAYPFANWTPPHAGGRAAIRRKRFAVYYLAFGFQRLLSLRHYLRPLIAPVFPKWRSIRSRRTGESRLSRPRLGMPLHL